MPIFLKVNHQLESRMPEIERNRGKRWRFFREIRCNVEGDKRNDRRITRLEAQWETAIRLSTGRGLNQLEEKHES